ncbi:MAG: glycosyltransferase family 4 protein [Clostridia bacterium]
MPTLKRLVVVSEHYPVAGDPIYTFVDELLVALDALGVSISVISPKNLTRTLVHGGGFAPRKWLRKTESGSFPVYQPRSLSVSKLSARLNRALYRRAVKAGVRMANVTPDAYYAHFWPSGIACALAAPQKPLFVACGESTVDPSLAPDVAAIRGHLRGVICVSSKNRDECAQKFGIPRGDMIVLPNGINERRFHPLENRDALRAALGIAPNDFVVAFVGWFRERKGVKRLEQALVGLPVKVIYIGSGDLTPTGDNIAFCGRVEHEKVPEYLACADVFALPTLAEGCCNAIVEAMACGLPIVSSDLPFNDDILTPENALRVDPRSVSQIRSAIETLLCDRDRARAMGAQALLDARSLGVNQRAARIKAYIEERL